MVSCHWFSCQPPHSKNGALNVTGLLDHKVPIMVLLRQGNGPTPRLCHHDPAWTTKGDSRLSPQGHICSVAAKANACARVLHAAADRIVSPQFHAGNASALVCSTIAWIHLDDERPIRPHLDSSIAGLRLHLDHF